MIRSGTVERCLACEADRLETGRGHGVAIEITILIFCFLLTARYDREELDPKFLFVELN